MESKDERQALWDALGLAWELGYTIAIPLVLLAAGGRLIDRWLGTTPWALLTGVLLSVVFSGAAVTRKVRDITRGSTDMIRKSRA